MAATAVCLIIMQVERLDFEAEQCSFVPCLSPRTQRRAIQVLQSLWVERLSCHSKK